MSTVPIDDQLRGSLAITPSRAELAEQPSSFSMMQLAIEKGATLDQLDRLMAMQDRFEATQARKAYVAAMAAFKKEPILITKDQTNKQYDSRYTSIGNLVNTVTPFLSKHGLSAEWHLDQMQEIRVGCTITHSLGHSGETKWMTVPKDTSGAKNPLQQIKSSLTYAKISTFELACGLASSDGNLDDDGNGSGSQSQSGGVSEEEYDRMMGLIEAANTLPLLQKTFAECFKVARAAGDQGAMAGLTKAKDKRKSELQ